MKWLKRLGSVLLVIVFLVAVAAALMYRRLSATNAGGGGTVSAAARAAEDAKWRLLGLVVPDAGIVLERPFDPPLSSRSYVVPRSWIPPLPKQLLAARG